jgi:hypothetical protein
MFPGSTRAGRASFSDLVVTTLLLAAFGTGCTLLGQHYTVLMEPWNLSAAPFLITGVAALAGSLFCLLLGFSTGNSA